MIKIATKEDAKALHLLESFTFTKTDGALSLNSFYYHIKKNILFVYKKELKIAGYILWLKRKNSFRLYSICINKDFQSQGLAKELLEYSFKNLKASKYTLEVKTTNQKAITLYEKYGFLKQKILKDFYDKNCDAFLMEKIDDESLQKTI